MVSEARLKRLRFRAWHRGTREADYVIGGYFERFHLAWSEAEVAWFETLLEQEDADILAWAMGKVAVPARFDGEAMKAMQKLDYVEIPR
jgi:antitoxin CptB